MVCDSSSHSDKPTPTAARTSSPSSWSRLLPPVRGYGGQNKNRGSGNVSQSRFLGVGRQLSYSNSKTDKPFGGVATKTSRDKF